MSFLIAETFTKSLGKLNPLEQTAVKQAAFDFQMNPAAPGFNFETAFPLWMIGVNLVLEARFPIFSEEYWSL